MLGRDFLIKGHSVRKPKVPVEEEGKWERQRGSCPTGSEARSQAHICGGRTGERGSPTEAHQDHSPFTTHTQAQLLHPSRHPGGPHTQLWEHRK